MSKPDDHPSNRNGKIKSNFNLSFNNSFNTSYATNNNPNGNASALDKNGDKGEKINIGTPEAKNPPTVTLYAQTMTNSS